MATRTRGGAARAKACLPGRLRPVGWTLAALLLAPASHADEQSGEEGQDGAEVREQDGQPPIEVFVHGRSSAGVESPRDPTVASYVLRGEALHAPGLSAAGALERVPGVQATRSGGPTDLATASVRGTTSAQTPIWLAGIRLNDDLTGSVDLSTVPLWLLDRVEIFRGNAPDDSEVFGMGGAVRFEPRLPRRRETALGVGVGSFGQREAHALYADGTEAASSLFALRLERTQGDFVYLHDGGTALDPSDDREVRRLNGDGSLVDAWAVGRWRTRAPGAGPGSVTVLVNGFAREAGAPGLQVQAARHARSRLRRVLAGAVAHTACSRPEADAPNGGCELELSTSGLLSAYRLLDPSHELGAVDEQRNEGQRLTEHARLRLPLGSMLDVRLGLLHELGQLRADVEQSATLRAERRTTRWELGSRLRPTPPLVLVAATALECQGTQAHGQEHRSDGACGELEPVGRLGARWTVAGPLSLLGNVGRYVRVPTLGELYGTSAVVRGNPELEPEQGLTADAGASLRGSAGLLAGYAQLVGFVRFADDLIGYRRSSFGEIRPYNVAAARVLGLEASTGGELWDFVEGGAAVTGLDPRDVSDDRQVANDLLTFQSRLVVAPYLGVATPSRWGSWQLRRASLTVRYRYRSSRVADPAGLVVLADQGQLDVEAAASLLGGRLRLSARLDNLLDQRTYDVVGYPLPGRGAYAMMEASW